VRREQDVRAEHHLHLGGVPVSEQAIGGEILVDRVEMGLVLQRLAGARHAGDGVDQDGARLDQVEQRAEREDRRGRVAARGGDRAGAPDRLAVDLGNAVYEAAEQIGRLMLLLVPLLVGGGIAEPEVGAEIDEGDVAVEDLGRDPLGMAVRQSGEDEVDTIEQIRRDSLDDRFRISEGKVGMDGIEPASRGAFAAEPHRPQLGMPGAQPKQLSADEARRTKDRYANHSQIMRKLA
jgi:hypothetical protein